MTPVLSGRSWELRRRRVANIVSTALSTTSNYGPMLRFLTRSVLLLALIAPVTYAQKKTKEVKPGSIELIRLENQWAAGLVKRDGALLERLLAPQIVAAQDYLAPK